MRIALIVVILVILPVAMTQAHALREVAGKVDVNITPGTSKAFTWGLLSDSNNTTTVQLTSQGQGSEFLSFPKSITLNAHALVYVNVTASVPSTYPGNVHLTPILYATQAGAQGGPTIINIQMAKMVTLAIAPNPNPQIAAQAITNNTAAQQTTNTEPSNAAGSTVPEFGPLSAIILTISVVAVIILSARIRFSHIG